jgi:hypothetical protein
MVGMPPSDWAASGLAAGTLLVADSLAMVTPALKAVRVNPVTALRQE